MKGVERMDAEKLVTGEKTGRGDKTGTGEKITWCPGCANNAILAAVKEALANLEKKGVVELKDVVAVTGIGCHAKIYDYLNANGFYGLHGRVLPTAMGIKLGNPKLTVIGFGGDGDTYAEGIEHFIHACRYNTDFTMLVHNNQTFALTTGQATPTSEQGFKGASTPTGAVEQPLNPIALALVSGATFVARAFALDVPHLTSLIEQAVQHRGFAVIDILEPCLIWHNNNTTQFFRQHTYKLEESDHNVFDINEALRKAREWDYSSNEDAKIPIGVFYKEIRPTYEEQWQAKTWHAIDRKPDWKRILAGFK